MLITTFTSCHVSWAVKRNWAWVMYHCVKMLHQNNWPGDCLVEEQIQWNEPFGNSKRWSHLLNQGDCVIVVKFTVNKGTDFWEFNYCLLNRGWPPNRVVSIPRSMILINMYLISLFQMKWFCIRISLKHKQV